MSEILLHNPVILLFLIAALGYFFGSVKVNGNSLGVAAVLFVGLVFGAVNPELEIPPIVFSLGIVLFTYSIGLSSGAAFFKSFKSNGKRDILFSIMMLTITALMTGGIGYCLGLDPETIVGIYSGSTTNTPALAGVINYINERGLSPENAGIIENAVVAYSYTYPMGVISGLLAIVLMERLLRIDFSKEAESVQERYFIEETPDSWTIEVRNEEVFGRKIRDIRNEKGWNLIFGRIYKEDQGYSLVNYDTVLEEGDKFAVVGGHSTLEEVEAFIGPKINEHISDYRSEYDIRSIFVSDTSIVGRSISSLNLYERYDAIITRIRRGDAQMLALPDTVLELGDRIRIVGRKRDLDQIQSEFGDSYFQASKVNLFTFGLGIALGLFLGLLEIQLPGDINIKLGIAGGPLIVGLILGYLKRTGPIVWIMPYSAGVLLRQLGLILLLAVIGLRSGGAFIESLTGGNGLLIFGLGALVSFLTAVLTLFVGYRLLKIPFAILMGYISNQPAILEFGLDRSKNMLPLQGYTIMFPIALILKIIYAQVLFLLLW